MGAVLSSQFCSGLPTQMFVCLQHVCVRQCRSKLVSHQLVLLCFDTDSGRNFKCALLSIWKRIIYSLMLRPRHCLLHFIVCFSEPLQGHLPFDMLVFLFACFLHVRVLISFCLMWAIWFISLYCILLHFSHKFCILFNILLLPTFNFSI